MRLAARPALCALLAAAVAGCDGGGGPSAEATFQGVDVAARGAAQLEVVGGALVVSGLGGPAAGGFTVGGDPARLDVDTDAVALPAGASFGVVVDDAAGAPVAEFGLVGTAPGAFRTRFAFSDASGVTVARVTYRLRGDVVFSIPDLPLPRSRGASAVREGSAGDGDGEGGSVHVIRDPSTGKYSVVGDSEGSGARGACVGFTVTPPVSLPPTQFPDGTLCADWIEVTPLNGTPAAAASASVVAQGVGTLTVRSLGRE